MLFSIGVIMTFPSTVVHFTRMKLNVLTYNIRGDMWTDESTSELARIVQEHDVDILFLQEVTEVFNDPGATQPKKLLNGLCKAFGPNYRSISYLPVQSPNKSAGNALVYKKGVMSPIGAEYNKYFPKISQRTIVEEWANKFMLPIRRIVMSEKFKFDHTKLIAYNVHLDYFGGDTRRIYQLQYFFKLWGRAREENGVIEIIAGDFNTWLPVKLYRIWRWFSVMPGYLKSRGFKEITEHIAWTHQFDRAEVDRAAAKGSLEVSAFQDVLSRLNNRYKQKLDHIWVRGDVDVISCERLDVTMSDHYPVLAKLNVNEKKDAESS